MPQAVILKLDPAGKLSEVSLDNVKHSAAALPNPPAQSNQRNPTITQIRYMDGKVLVAGLSNEEFSSNMKVIDFPFQSVDKGSSIEMYHGSHGRFETNSPIRTFVPYTIDNQKFILAAYTCTPLVKIPMSEFKAGCESGRHHHRRDGRGQSAAGHGSLQEERARLHPDGQLRAWRDQAGCGAPGYLQGRSRLPATSLACRIESLSDWKDVKHLQAYDDKSVLVLSGAAGAMDLKTVALP